MKCDRCEHENNQNSIVCEKCNTPLNIKGKQLEKGNPIDIEEAPEKEVDTFDKTHKRVFSAMVVLIIIIILLTSYLGYYLLNNNKSLALMEKYHDLIQTSPLTIIYFGRNENIIELSEQYADNYDFDFLNMEISKLMGRNKREINLELNVDIVESTYLVLEKGKLVAVSSNINNTDAAKAFLYENNIVPLTYVDTEPILEELRQALSSVDPTVIYFATKDTDDFESKSEVLNSLAKEHSFNVVIIEGYLLSNRQLLRKMSQLNFTEIQDNLIIYVNEGDVVTNLDDSEITADDYFDIFVSYDIIDKDIENNLTTIGVKKFERIIASRERSVVIIGLDNSFCNRLKVTAGGIVSQHEAEIFYLKETKSNKDRIQKLISELGYKEGFSYPFTIIIEKERIIDYIIGLVDKQLFTEKLTENGIIR